MAAEFWDSKPVSEWTPIEIARLSTSSPWAIKTHVRVGGEAPDVDLLPHVPNRATWDQIDTANQTAAAATQKSELASSAPFAFYGEVIVTWESAAPLRLIRKSELRPEFQGHYVIRVTGLPDAALKRLEAREMKKASLGIAPNRRIGPDLVQVNGPEKYIEFAFLTRALPLSASDRSVGFIMVLDQMSIQVHFDLSRMRFQHRFAL